MADASRKSASLRLVPLLVLAAIYIAWARAFIAISAAHVSGARYYCLFDDAMVSLRYAWNLSHGVGLVWNPGERVEGITSFSFTLLMSVGALFFSKSSAALFVQLIGIPLVLCVAWMASRLDQLLCGSGIFGMISAVAVVAYYPLSYWPLMGMETGLLTALAFAALMVAMRLGADARGSWLLGLLLGLMFTTRPDALVPALVILVFRAAQVLVRHRHLRALRPWLVEAFVLAVVVAGLTLFRRVYYGAWLPNTYQLKMANWPLRHRLHNGWLFIEPFLEQARYLFLLALCALVLQRNSHRLLLACFALSVLACQIWVGGDAWPYWRMLVPGVGALIVLAVDGARALVRLLLRKERAALVFVLCVPGPALALWAADQPFLDELCLRIPPYTVDSNRSGVEASLELARFADPRGSLAVAAAGAVPYYSGLRGIDILGKSDRYIAQLPGLGYDGQRVTPGHNKFDLHYSIEHLRPDAIYDAVAWTRHGGGDVFEFVRQNYVQRGSFWLRRDSPYIRWDRVPAP